MTKDGMLTPTEVRTIERWLNLTRDVSPELGCFEYSLCGDLELDRTVAEIVLSNIQHQLPNWNGEARTIRPHQARTIESLPLFLFTINWADSGPGFSWPEAYYVTYVPELDVRIFTASHDSTEVWDCTDLAIGWEKAHPRPAIGAYWVITRWWRMQEGSDGSPWQNIFSEGLIDDERAQKWRAQVWRQ